MKTTRKILTFLICITGPLIFCQQPKLVVPIGHQMLDKGGLTTAKFSFDEKLVVTAHDDKTAKIWNVPDGRLIRSLEGHTAGVSYAEFSPDGKFVLTHSHDDGTVKIWDVTTGNLIHNFQGSFPQITRYSPDGKLVLIAAPRGMIIWRPETEENIAEIPLRVESADFNADGTYAIADQYKKANGIIWDFANGKIIELIGHTDILFSVKFSNDGKLAITTSRDKTARIWDSQTGSLIHTLPGEENGWTSATFSPDGLLALTTSAFKYSVTPPLTNIWSVKTGTLLQTITGPGDYSGFHAAFRPASNLGIFSVDGTAMIENLLTGTTTYLSGEVSTTTSASLSPDGKSVVEVAKFAGVTLFRDQSNGLPFYSMSDSIQIRTGQFSSDGKYLANDRYGQVAIWNTSSGKLLSMNLRDDTYPWRQLRFSSDGSQYATFDWVNTAKIWESATGKLIISVTHKEDISDVKFSPDGSLIATAFDKTSAAVIWNAQTGKPIHTLKHSNVVDDICFSPDGNWVVTICMDDVKIWNRTSGNLVKKIVYGEEDLPTMAQFSNDGKRLAIAGIIDLHMLDFLSKKELWRVQTQTVRYNNLFGVSNLDQLYLSPDGNWIIGAFKNNIFKIWNQTTGKELYALSGKIESVDWNKATLLINDNSLLSLFDLEKGEIILSWVNVNTNDWVVTHPSGLFDASPGAMDKLYFVQGLDFIDFNQLKERYYEPGLWKKVMAGEPLRNVVGFKSIDLPPDIQVGQVDDKGFLNITLTNRGGGIGEVNLFVNGKEIIKDARDADVKPDAPNASLKVFVGKHKSIVKGQENLIAVKAWNKDHWVQSRGQVVSYHSKEIESYKPAVHILTCGVSDYTGIEIDLKYAAKDANDVSVALQLGAKKLFGAERSYVYNLTTTQAKEFYPTKTNILKSFEKISSTAHPLDVFVMYLSGHGINYGGQDGDWHYLTQEAYTASGAAYNDPAIRGQTTISSNELVELFKKVPALKQVLMLDACASGKVVDNLMAQKDIESSTLRALDRMRDRTGMHIITGCTADAVSYEASKYGQGVLTYSLLEGIRGAALREDRYVDVNKLFQYAQDRVPQLAEGIGGIQSPQVFSPHGSQSFDIGLLSEVEKKEIPIAKIRPVYIRSNFQDENEMEDVLGLGKLINESLNEVSSKGIDSQIIFVDVADYPEGCKLIGRYKKEGGKIILKLRKKCGAEDKTYDLKADGAEELKAEILKVL